MKGKLYIVATPIGNLEDFTFRALSTLKSVDVIACEDTRHTLALLNKYGVKKPLVSYYRQKEREGADEIAAMLDGGKNVALVSDAGMPCISDPGAVLVKKLMDGGYGYTVIPGANAAVSAVALCGTDGGFSFIGFLPEKAKDRQKILDAYKAVPCALVFYAAPHDVNGILDILYSSLGDRTVYIVKEITKIYENVTKGTLKDTRVENPQGEFVLVVEKSDEKKIPPAEDEIRRELVNAVSGGTDKKTAVKQVAEKLGISKNAVYKISINLR
jgi:16S rRNA (cytidine1402-2'-O)-methyltransferase